MNLTKYKLYLFAVLVAFIPWSIAVTSVVTILLMLTTLIERNYSDKLRNLLRNTPLLLLTGFFVVHIVSLLYSTDKSAAAFDLEKKLSLLLYPFILVGYTGLTNKKDLPLIYNVFVASVTIACFYCLCYALYRNYAIGDPATLDYSFSVNFGIKNTFGLYWDYFSYSELARPLKLHPTYFSIFTAFTIIILFQKLLESESLQQWSKAGIVVLILFLLFFTLLLSSRIVIMGLFLSLAIICVMHFIKHGINRKKLSLMTGATLVTVALLFILPVTRHRLLTETASLFGKGQQSTETGVSQRSLVWSTAVQIARKYAIPGTGVGDVQSMLDKAYTAQDHAELVGLNAHSQFLQTLLGTGVVGFLLLLLIFMFPLTLSIRRGDTLRTAFLILVFLASFTEAILQNNKGIVFFSFFYCFLFQGYKEATD